MHGARLAASGRSATLAAGLLVAAAGLGPAVGAQRGTLPANVDAVYRISFTALGDIGRFHFNSKIDGDAYALAADAKIKTAIFDYWGDMSSRGVVRRRSSVQPWLVRVSV